MSAPPIRQVRVCGSLCALSSRRSLWLCSDSFQNGPYASVTILLGAASTHNGLGRSRDDSWERCRSILRFDSSHHRLCPPSRIAAGVVATFFVVRGSKALFLLYVCVCQVCMVILDEMVTHVEHDTPLFARGALRRVLAKLEE